MPKIEENLLKEKITSFFNSNFNKLFSKLENDINKIEEIKYDFYDNCIREYSLLEEKLIEIKNKPNTKRESLKNQEKNNINPCVKETTKKNQHILNKSFDHIIDNKNDIKKKDKNTKGKNHIFIKHITNFNNYKLNNNTPPNSQRERPKTPIYLIKDSKKDLNLKKNKKNNSQKKNEKSIILEKNDNLKEENNILTKQKLNNNIQNVKIQLKTKEKINKPSFIYPIPNSLINSKILSGLYLCIKNNFLTDKENAKLLISNKELYKIEKNNLEKIRDINNKELIEKKNFIPSKTALNSLIFITKEEILSLVKSNLIPLEITLIFKLIYIIIDENYNGEGINKLIENLVNFILPKYKSRELKNLLINYFNLHKNLNLNKTKIEKIRNIIIKNPKIISNKDIKKLNRPISYITYLLKEINDFINQNYN